MKLEYICNECGQEISSNQYEELSEIFCPECGGHIEENTAKTWCFSDTNGQLKGPFYSSDLREAFLNKEIHEQTEIFKLDTSKWKPLINWDSLKSVTKSVTTAVEEPTTIVAGENTKKTLLVTCESCSHQFSKRAEACPKCGWKPQIICQICHQKIPFDSSVCPECGDPSPFELQEKTKKEEYSSGYKKTTSVPGSKDSPFPVNETPIGHRPSNVSLSWYLFSFNGRISRQAFWCAYPVIFLLGLILSVALESVKESTNMNGLFIIVILALLLLWPSLAIQVKRWHDRNKSGYWIILNMLPLIGFLWVTIELGFLKGTVGNNDYGTDPLS